MSTSNPTLYMWWLHTTKPNTPIDIIAYTIPRYPNMVLLEWAEMVVLITPKPGMIRIYTSGCPKNQNKCWYNIGSPPPATSKKDVLKFLSVRIIVIPPARTGRDSNSNTAVTITAHPNSANLCNFIPGLLIFSIVVIKLPLISYLSLKDEEQK